MDCINKYYKYISLNKLYTKTKWAIKNYVLFFQYENWEFSDHTIIRAS